MNRSRLAALSAGAMFLVASVLAPAVATADTGGTNTIKAIVSPSTINPPVSTGTVTVNIAANGSTQISGASGGVAFDNTKVQLTALAKNSALVTAGASYGGFPGGAAVASFIATANSTGQIPNIGYFYTDGTFDPANTDITIYTATFSIIASGDATFTVNSSPSMLNGNGGAGVAPYGQPITPLTLVNGVLHNSFQPIWSLTAPASASLLTGADSTGYSVSTAVTQGNPGTINLSISGLPSGVTADFTPASGTDAFTSTLVFHATAGASIGQATVTVSAAAAGATKTANINLTVAGNNDFSVSANPGSLSVNGGATSAAVNVSTAVLTGTPGTITLSAPGLPAWLTPNFASTSVAAGTGTTVTFTAGAGAVNGIVPVTISATNGTWTRTAPVSLNVIVISGVGATVNVSGSLDSGFLGLTCPTSLTIPLLRGNTNQVNVPCQVYTNTVWNLSAADPKATNTGHMTTSDPTPYVMPDSMHVLARSFISGGDVFYGNDVDLANGTGTSCNPAGTPAQPCTGGSNTQVPITGGVVLSGTNSAAAPLVLSQYVASNTQPGSYGINVVFAAVSVF